MALCERMRGTVEEIMPAIQTQVSQRASSTPPIDFGTAENWLIRSDLVNFVKQAVQDNLTEQDFSYQKGFGGDPSVIGAIAGLFNRRFSPITPVLSEHVAVAPGGAAVLESLLLNICCPGDAMLVMAPFWSGFHFQFSVGPKVTIIPVKSKTEEALTDKVTDDLEAALACSTDKKVKGVVLCNPHNPLGQCYPKSTLEAILRFCEKHDLHLISDEIYALSVFNSCDVPNPVPFQSILDLDLSALKINPARAHVLWSVSKDFGCSGLRLGALISQHNPAMVCGVAMAANTQVSGLTAVAMTALLSNAIYVDTLIDLNQSRLSCAYASLTKVLRENGIEYIPAYAGVYVWARLSDAVKTWEQEGQLKNVLAGRNVAVSAGKSYAAIEPGWYRLSFALKPEVLEEGLSKMMEGLVAFEEGVKKADSVIEGN